MALPCMNCKRADFSPGDGKFFAEAFVCPTCFFIAERLYEQGDRELRQVLVTLKELIRVAIVEGRLTFAPAPEENEETQASGPSKKAFEVIADMLKEKSCRESQGETSSPTTVSDAPMLGAGGHQPNEFTGDSDSLSATPSPASTTGGSGSA